MFLYQHYLVESQVSNYCGQNLSSDPNGALAKIDHFQMVHSTVAIGRYETTSLYTAIEWKARLVTTCTVGRI